MTFVALGTPNLSEQPTLRDLTAGDRAVARARRRTRLGFGLIAFGALSLLAGGITGYLLLSRSHGNGEQVIYACFAVFCGGIITVLAINISSFVLNTTRTLRKADPAIRESAANGILTTYGLTVRPQDLPLMPGKNKRRIPAIQAGRIVDVTVEFLHLDSPATVTVLN